MKRSCFLVVLMLLSLPAYAGDSISFAVGGRRVQIEAPGHCRSTSCASVSVSGVSRNRDRYGDDDRYDDDDYDDDRYSEERSDNDRYRNQPVRALPLAPSTVAPPAPPVSNPLAAAPPPTVYKLAVSSTKMVAAPTAPPARPAAIPVPPAPPPPASVAKAPEPLRPAPVAVPQISRVSNAVEEDADTPVGDWKTEGKGAVRIAKCGNALCGYVLNASSNDKGEAVLINMKPKSETQWTGNVYSHASGDSYYGTMDMKGANTLRVEACALGRFYCSGNNWSRINAKPESLMSSRQAPSVPRS